MTLTAGMRLGSYEILTAIGSGGMGEVYKARDTRLDRIVAIKVLPPQLASDPQFHDRFEREARIVAALSHPHICPIFDVGRERLGPERPFESLRVAPSNVEGRGAKRPSESEREPREP